MHNQPQSLCNLHTAQTQKMLYTVSKKRPWCTLNFDAHQPILVIFGRDVAETVHYQMVICYLTSSH